MRPTAFRIWNETDRPTVRWGVALGTALVALFVPGPAQAGEPVEAFLEALRSRQMHDVALEYLDSLRTSRLVDDEVRQTILYEEAKTLVDEARTLRDMTRRSEQLELARQKFEQFLQEQPSHSLAASAGMELGNVRLERGRTALEKSRRPVYAEEKPQLIEEARSEFEEARKVFTDADARFDAELKEYPTYIDRKETELLARRDRALLNLIQARLLSASVTYELAKSYPSESKQRTELLEQAAGQYAQIYEQYQRRLAGLYARLWQGRCYQDLGNRKQALTYYGELLAQPDDPEEFRVLKRKALRLAMECWLDDPEPKHDEAIRQGTEWLQQARGSEPQTAEGLAIQWLTAKALQMRAATLDDRDGQKQRDLREATRMATEVARLPGDYQEEAKQMVATLRNLESDGEPTDFASAQGRAKAALDAMTLTRNKLNAARKGGEDAEAIKALQQEYAEAQADALRYYRLALTLRNEETPIDDLNQARYFLCYLLYSTGQHYDAAVLGEFLARNYPDHPGARPAAKIALASYLAAYNASPVEQRSFETGRMFEIAKYVGQQWPDSAEANEAWMILGDLAIRSGQPEEAVEYLSNIPEDSPKRAEADLKAGQALWSGYLAAVRLPEDERPPQSDLDARVQQAATLLERGQQQLRGKLSGGIPSYTLLAAELSLVQLHLNAGRAEAARELLEIPETGALALVRAKHPITEANGFRNEAYKSALRAYVGVGALDQAEAVMQELDQLVAETGEGEAALTKIYISLGRELEEQVARLRTENKNDELKGVLGSFEKFLKSISQRDEGNTFNSLMWVAETFYGLGEGLDDGSGAPSAEAKRYYDEAARTFEKVLDEAKRDESFAAGQPPGLLNVRLRLARCERRLGNFKEALRQLVNVLVAQPNTLDAQLEAAYIYQDWGRENASYYGRASRGARLKLRDGREIQIWGWNALANRLQANPQFRHVYHEARYNLARCSYLQAMAKTGQERTEELRNTTRIITVMSQLDPTLGGDEWRGKYDRLLKAIQRESGERPVGLRALEVGGEATARASG